MSLLELNQVNKIYQSGKLVVPALFEIDLKIEKGEMVAIMGPSGSGKSTLMNIIGLLDRPTSGELKLKDNLITLEMSDKKVSKLRSQNIGFVFQTFNLLPKLTALGNVLLPTIYSKSNKKERQQRARELLNKVGLRERIHHKPGELSGGEKQRVAIARALINNPEIILADEPTGNLDSKSGLEIIDILTKLNLSEHKTILIVTHDPNIAKRCRRQVRLLDGRIIEDKND